MRVFDLAICWGLCMVSILLLACMCNSTALTIIGSLFVCVIWFVAAVSVIKDRRR